ncbi:MULTISPECIES: cupin domain-containing protein [unclassified Streptomyces]|uniref:cupin domain-containing protein n=1 Tax=unclassified Streptomyces TaxID=2593676 RepID=UPI0011C7C3C6|nr:MULTISPECIES: cupin domain-containing protein [unclassified Streptomyces]TXS12893.1 cupin [Streptomyces sp. wa22]WSQ89319.1 cupin domain-containing protein [Streptomyces sp. NBC_01212]WSR04673.1 cupin domain-containing protein [Streptomyces sp. NBC_01208]
MSVFRTEIQDVGAQRGAGVLESRLTGLSREEFGRDVWARTAALTRGASDFSDVFSPSAVDELISRRGLRTPFLRVAKDGSTLPESSFTAPAGVGATIADQLDDTALWRAFADGATLVLQALHRTWEPVADLVSDLSTELGHPVQANAYVTPPQNRGFDAHYDVHDVFVLQIEGTKRWIIHEPLLPDPMRDQPWTDHRPAVADRAARGTAHLDTVLRPGDVLYMPRGWLHSARTQGHVSIHVTLGVHPWTRYALAEQLARAALAALRDDPPMRESLPLGASGRDGERDVVRERLLAAVAKADPAPSFERARRAQGRPAPLGPLAQLSALNGLRPTSPVRLREAVEPWLSGTRLFTRVGYLDLPASDLVLVTRLLDGRIRTAGDLGLALAERLLRAGVLLPGNR